MGSRMSTMWLDTWWTWKRSTLTKVTLTRESSREDRRSFSNIVNGSRHSRLFSFFLLSLSLFHRYKRYSCFDSREGDHWYCCVLRISDSSIQMIRLPLYTPRAIDLHFYKRFIRLCLNFFVWTIINPLSGYVVDHSSPKRQVFLTF